MPFNGAGTFAATASTVAPAQNGTTISDTDFNALVDEIEAGLSNVICKDGQTTVTANIPMNSHKLTGLVAGTTAGDSASIIDTGSFSVACTGPFASTNCSITYMRVGRQVVLNVETTTALGNNTEASISMNLTNMPAAIRPAIQLLLPCVMTVDGGSDQSTPGVLVLPTSGAGTVFRTGASGSFNATTLTTGFYVFSVAYLAAV